MSLYASITIAVSKIFVIGVSFRYPILLLSLLSCNMFSGFPFAFNTVGAFSNKILPTRSILIQACAQAILALLIWAFTAFTACGIVPK